MNNYDLDLDQFWESMVKILDSKGTTVGSGFIIHSDGYIITCHHVIYPLYSLNVEYCGQDYQAQWCEEYSNPEVDIAVLKIDIKDAKPIAIEMPKEQSVSIMVYGFPYAQEKKGFSKGFDIYGILSQSPPINTRATYGNNDVQQLALWNKKPNKDSIFWAYRIDQKVDRGTSGGPVIDRNSGAAIGVIQCRSTGSQESYVISWKNITKSLNFLRVKHEQEVSSLQFEVSHSSQKFKKMSHAVILTALPVEYRAVRTHLSDVKEIVHPQGDVYERGIFSTKARSWDICIVETGAGNTRAAQKAERAINYFNPDVVFFVGVAGGIKDVHLGDVVAATKVYGYESGKVKKTFKLRPDVGLSSFRIVERAKAEGRKTDWLQKLETDISQVNPSVFVAPIAAGEKVVASTESDVWTFLRQNYSDAVAVEMEGRGFLEATYANLQVSALVIRGISDLVNGKSKADEEGFQKIASRHASAFAFEVLAKFDVSIKVGVENEKIYPLPQIGLSKLKSRLKRKQEEIIRKEKQRKDLEERIDFLEKRKNIVGIDERYRYEIRLEDLTKSLNEVIEEIDNLKDEIEIIQKQINDITNQ